MKFEKFCKQFKELEKQLPSEMASHTSEEDLTDIPKKDREVVLEIMRDKVAFANFINELVQESEESACDVQEEPININQLKSETDEILAERGSNYGKFTNHAKLSQLLKITFDNHVREYGNPELFTSSMNEAIEMIFHKLARIANGNPTYDDSWKDISGYSTLIVKELNGESI